MKKLQKSKFVDRCSIFKKLGYLLLKNLIPVQPAVSPGVVSEPDAQHDFMRAIGMLSHFPEIVIERISEQIPVILQTTEN